MTLWFTADHHFGHANIIKYANRPFADVDEMDSALIMAWNDKVKPFDTVWYIGDFTLGDYKSFRKYVTQLNGNIYFLPGSHDHEWIKNFLPASSLSGRVDLAPALHTIESEQYSEGGFSKPIVMCHYAMRSWDRSHYKSWHLFGHHHGNLAPYGLSFDVGVDCHHFAPISIEEVAEKMSQLVPIVDYSKTRNGRKR